MREWQLRRHVQYTRNCSTAMRNRAAILAEQAQHHNDELAAEQTRVSMWRCAAAEDEAQTMQH
jgi:hypothetical protein